MWAERQAVSVEAWDAAGEALFVNHAWRNLWQMPGSVLVGSGYSIFQDAQFHAKPVWPFLQNGFAKRVTVETPPSYYDPREEDGRPGLGRWTEGRIVPLWTGEDAFDEIHGPMAYVILLNDVTKMISGRQRVVRAAEDLQDGLRDCARLKKRELMAWAQGKDVPRVLQKVAERKGPREPAECIAEAPPPQSALTVAEQRVVAMLAEGYSTKEIAALLQRSEKTVYAQFNLANEKLGLDSLSQLTVYACRWHGAFSAK